MLTTIKWITVVCDPTLTMDHLKELFDKKQPDETELTVLWLSYADYLMEVFCEYQLTDRLRTPDEEFFNDVCFNQLYGAVEPEQLIEVFEKLTRMHRTYILEALDMIANVDGYLKALEGQWRSVEKTGPLPLLFFECSTLYDFIEGDSFKRLVTD